MIQRTVQNGGLTLKQIAIRLGVSTDALLRRSTPIAGTTNRMRLELGDDELRIANVAIRGPSLRLGNIIIVRKQTPTRQEPLKEPPMGTKREVQPKWKKRKQVKPKGRNGNDTTILLLAMKLADPGRREGAKDEILKASKDHNSSRRIIFKLIDCLSCDPIIVREVKKLLRLIGERNKGIFVSFLILKICDERVGQQVIELLTELAQENDFVKKVLRDWKDRDGKDTKRVRESIISAASGT